MTLEKISEKLRANGERTNKVYEMLKSIGGVDNLIDINNSIQEKLNDINEATKFIERIGAKTEKIFIDLSKGLGDLILLKARLDEIDSDLRNVVKFIDGMDAKLDAYVTKKDMDEFKSDYLVIKRQVEELNKLIPISQLKLPESVNILLREREDITLLIESLNEQLKSGRIGMNEYQAIKDKNTRKLSQIEKKLKAEWKKVEKLPSVLEKEKLQEARQPPKQESEKGAKPEEKKELAKEKENKKEKSKSESKNKNVKKKKHVKEKKKKIKKEIRKKKHVKKKEESSKDESALDNKENNNSVDTKNPIISSIISSAVENNKKSDNEPAKKEENKDSEKHEEDKKEEPEKKGATSAEEEKKETKPKEEKKEEKPEETPKEELKPEENKEG